MPDDSYTLKQPLDVQINLRDAIAIFDLMEDSAAGGNYTAQPCPATVKLPGERVLNDAFIEFLTLPTCELIN